MDTNTNLLECKIMIFAQLFAQFSWPRFASLSTIAPPSLSLLARLGWFCQIWGQSCFKIFHNIGPEHNGVQFYSQHIQEFPKSFFIKRTLLSLESVFCWKMRTHSQKLLYHVYRETGDGVMKRHSEKKLLLPTKY